MIGILKKAERIDWQMTKYYKGFNKDMTCRNFQYEEGKEYTEAKAVVCQTGFHACEYPLDCFDYYPPCDGVYHEVELGDDAHGDNSDTKKCSTRIKIGASLDVKGLVKAAFEYTKERCVSKETGGNRAALTGGDQAALTGGDRAAANALLWPHGAMVDTGAACGLHSLPICAMMMTT